ncbi:hypothetical protein [Vibrio sonorensis]|uniref:hypothetical protein n=1 Tax=Vibrio sonorensis TaxID=1004316 RepID=UPI0008D8FB62|nr:hypothetical protein [Vibrio sonorensis]
MVMRTDQAGREAYQKHVESHNVQARADSQFYGSKKPEKCKDLVSGLTVQQKADAKFYAKK